MKTIIAELHGIQYTLYWIEGFLGLMVGNMLGNMIRKWMK